MDAKPPPNLPERLGKYPVSGVIGRGAMGVVYRGVDPVIKRPVAIKTIRKELIDDDEHKAEATSDRFRREAQAAGALNHPGIVAVYEYGEDEKHAYIAMEYVEGNSLREYLRNGASFDERDAVSIMAQLLDALEFAHHNKVWHRDIKPANIIVMSNGRIKLTDFGIARLGSAELTRANVVMGTPGYIAPEHYLGQPIDHRVDVFSTGVLFYELSARCPPFRGRPEAIMHDVCYHDPEAASSLDPQHRWPQYDAAIARALSKAPGERFASAAAFRAAILAEYAHPVANTISEATIITQVARPIGGETLTPQTPAHSTPHATTETPPPTGWSAPVLAGVEIELARFVGPVARVLVRRAAKTHKDIDSLVVSLLDSLNRSEDRDAFSYAVLRRTPTIATVRSGGTSPPAPSGSHPPLAASELERTTRLLTSYIGPMAKIVVKRAANEGLDRRGFLHKLAQSLDSEAARERFLREAGG